MFKYSLLILICLAVTFFILLIYGIKPQINKIFAYTLTTSFVAMIFFNTFLTSLPIVVYNINSILGIRIITFPVEDIGYLVAVVILLPSLYEKLRDEKGSHKSTAKKISKS